MFLSLGRMGDIYPVLECNVTWPGPGAAWQCHECHAGRVRVSPVSQSDIIQTSRLCTLSVSECHSVSTLALSPGGGGQNESQIWKCFIPLPRGNMRTILLIPLFFLPGMLLMKLLYSRTFYRNVYSAKMTSFEKTNTNSARAPPKVSWITKIQPNLENPEYYSCPDY